MSMRWDGLISGLVGPHLHSPRGERLRYLLRLGEERDAMRVQKELGRERPASTSTRRRQQLARIAETKNTQPSHSLNVNVWQTTEPGAHNP